MDGEISPDELEGLIEEDGQVRIIDIRDTRDFARGHIPESSCIPYQRLPKEVDQLADASHIVTVCPHGEASRGAAKLIASYEKIDDDVTIESLEGGLEAWNGPLEEAREDDTEAPF
ncbi:MAG: rhodanese-like domain-containing protein [Halobacteriaceae archaeon]